MVLNMAYYQALYRGFYANKAVYQALYKSSYKASDNFYQGLVAHL